MLTRIKNINLMEATGKLLRKPVFQIGIVLIIVLVVGAAGFGIRKMQQAPPQPIQFNHQVHVKLGVQCLYCHPGAWRQASAGLPTLTKCWGCHQQITNSKPEQRKLVDFVNSGKPISWVPVFILPDFVYFNHRPHIAAGVNCEVCHGEISRETVAQPIPGENMGWCLNCHRTKAAGDKEMLVRLTYCATCHR